MWIGASLAAGTLVSEDAPTVAAGLLVGAIGVSGVFLFFGAMVVLAVVLIAVLARPLVDLDLDAALIQTDLVPGEPPAD